jgi:DNA-binding transcriptional ArsR family regulator
MQLSTALVDALLPFVAASVTQVVQAAEQIAPRLKALADVHRLTIVLLLGDQPMTVKDLQDATGLSQTLVSHHLGILRRAGLVRAEPRGRSNVYELCCEAAADPVRTLFALVESPLQPS